MHCRAATFVLLFAMTSQTACADRGENGTNPFNLVNKGFEADASVDHIPGWEMFQHGGEKSYVLSVDRKNAANGKRSLRFEQTHEQYYGLLKQRVAVTPDMIGKTVQLSGSLRSRDISPPGYNLWMGFYDMGPSLISSVEAPFVTGTTNWKRYDVSGRIPPRTAYIDVALQMFDHGKGGIGWADEMRLEFVDADPGKEQPRP